MPSPNGWPSTRSGWWALVLGSLVTIPAVVALALALGGCATVERTPSTPWTWEQYDSKLHDAALHYIPSYAEEDAVGKPAPVKPCI